MGSDADLGGVYIERIEEVRRANVLRAALALLPPKERRVLELRFGLVEVASDRDGDPTLADVGAEFGLTRERIRQIEQKALTRLRA